MPDPDDFKSTLDELEKAMLQSLGLEQPVKPPMVRAGPTKTQVNLPPDKTPEYIKRAEEDVPRIASLRSKMEAAAKKHRVPVEYLAGIASRESRGGKALNAMGYDDENQDFGVMQVNQNYHQLEGTDAPDSRAHIDQAAGILRDNKRQMDKKFPKWSDEERWRAAIAAYNMGASNVKSREQVDKGTTGGDYSQDVLIRARAFKQRFQTNKRKP